MTAYTKAITQPLDTDEAKRLFGFDPALYENTQHSSDTLEGFNREWFDKAVSILLDYQKIEVPEPILASLFVEKGNIIFASLVLVDVPVEYSEIAAGQKITRVAGIGWLRKEAGKVMVSEFSIDPSIRVYSKANLPSVEYLPGIAELKDLYEHFAK